MPHSIRRALGSPVPAPLVSPKAIVLVSLGALALSTPLIWWFATRG